MKPIPIFYDDSSSKSILTWWEEKDYTEGGPMPIIKLVKEAGLKTVNFVSTNFRSFVSAYKICEKAGVELRFGLELIIADALDKTPDSQINESKVIIWMKNTEGYKDLIKIYSAIHSNKDNKYYYYRGSWSMLKSLWTSNLILSFPWADSFIAVNRLKYKTSIVPDFSFTKEPIFFKESETDLLDEKLIDDALDNYLLSNKYDLVNTKTIYYNKKEDVKTCIVFRSIFIDKASFFDPKLENFSSDTFCFQKWKEINDRG